MAKADIKKKKRLSPGVVAMVAVPFTDACSPEVIARARKGGMDIAELRIDLFSSFDLSHVLGTVKKFTSKKVPVLATIRSHKEGGRWKGSESRRLEIFRMVIPYAKIVDIEFSSKAILNEVIHAVHAKKKKVMVSYHDFKKTPSMAVLKKYVRDAKKAGADLVKIAVMARSYRDVKNLAKLTRELKNENLVVIAMGEKGQISRVLFPFLGSRMTFASMEKKTAPGQLTLSETATLLKKLS